MLSSNSPHIPVMLQEQLDLLQPKDNGIYVDGTFGAGGVTQALLKAANCNVWSFDKDPTAITKAEKVKQDFPSHFHISHKAFRFMASELNQNGIEEVDGVTIDLGVSSMQIDEDDRGFSFQSDGPLDMRMSQSGKTAADIINHEEESKIAQILYEYGEERFSRRIARNIVQKRQEKPITRTSELAQIIRNSVPKKNDKIHPATRSFQALRIAVNEELDELKQGLQSAEKILKPDGVITVISFHSLEDKIVKNFFRDRSSQRTNTSRFMPPTQHSEPLSFELISKKAIKPSEKEIELNPRSRSARLRAARRLARSDHE